MSQPPTPIPPLLPPPPPQPPSLVPTTATTSTTNREYRKGNWTIQETLTLITAKKLDDERRSKPSTHSTSKPGEPRWKWVENYCWAHGCFRSQNQCNDKWDNLLRDYKKIREYQSRSNASDSFPSYWTMERQQRKFYNLPSNMSLEVFEALNEVVQRRCCTTQQNMSTTSQQQQQQQQLSVSVAASPPPETVREPPPEPEMDPPAVSESSATESGDKLDEAATKRRKFGNIGSSIKHSASILAQTIRSCQEKKERRHQQLVEFEQRRLQLEETRNEVNRQGMANLAVAITKLSTAIHSLISDQT
ncbi:trihelix transcription factor DF1-like isoform X2 [Manihot esculenta]|uniref:Uncharacterized protein n=1 Tax=Manihot esculenta TaxID=3983 RepID=A0ACB7GCH6_MANES|nr:trihelix transcription factor DF1-like isoform X2 [Manihot esculenta]KAG8637611.1 hypothetical protein MANES_15G141750v8 [Manihot esculenta]